MKFKTIKIKKKENEIEINVRVCNFLKKGFGLMFTSREKAQALLFEFRKPTKLKITSWFVFFSFVAIWIDEEEKIVAIKKVNPWQASVPLDKPFIKLVEIPINKKYADLVEKILK